MTASEITIANNNESMLALEFSHLMHLSLPDLKKDFSTLTSVIQDLQRIPLYPGAQLTGNSLSGENPPMQAPGLRHSSILSVFIELRQYP